MESLGRDGLISKRKNLFQAIFGTKYSRMDQIKFVEDSL